MITYSDKSNGRGLSARTIMGLFMLICFMASPISLLRAQTSDQSYIIGVGDILTISFWQEPELNTAARVGEDGMITLPVIGDIKAGGLSTSRLSKNIVEQMTFYHTPISQATVVVTEYHSRYVVVTGEITNPATQSYEKIPDLWRVILDAGGPTSMADLSHVTIIRKVGDKSEVLNVNMYDIIRSGDLGRAPELKPGDLVNVPTSSLGVAFDLGKGSKFEGKNIYYVLGNVLTPGVRNLEDGMDVLDAITAAGGYTPEADLKNVRVIVKGTTYSSIVKLDMEKYIEQGSPARLVLGPEDTVVIPARRSNAFSGALNAAIQIIPLITALGTLVLLSR